MLRLVLTILLTTVAVVGLGATLALAGGQLPVLNGDVDCSGSVTPVDSLKILRFDAGLGYEQAAGCAAIGDPGGGNPPGSVGLSRQNPVPAGSSLVVPEGWRIQIIDFIPNATQMVLNENQFNDPPSPGFKFAIVRVRMTNVAAGNPGDPDAGFALRMVGSRNVGYSTFEESCGVIPDDIDFKSDDIFVGGAVEGNICYQVGQSETGFVIYTHFFLADEEDARWFAVE